MYPAKAFFFGRGYPLLVPCRCKALQMKHLLTTIACFFALFMSAQSDAYPFNPDSDGDGFITVEDLLAVLSDLGTEAEVQTCFKGEICKYFNTPYWPLNQIHDSEGGCGTIVCKTWNSSSPTWYLYMTIHLTAEGYSEGDVIHLIHDFKDTGASVTFKTYFENNWVTVVSLTAVQYWETPTAKVMFNGEYWEALD